MSYPILSYISYILRYCGIAVLCRVGRGSGWPSVTEWS